MARGSRTLFNPNTTPVVFDKDGRIVAGGERIEISRVDEVGQEAIDHDLLVLEEPDSGDEPDRASDPAPAAKALGASAPKKAS